MSCAAAGTGDIVDGHLALLVPPDATVLTSAAVDVRLLLRTRRVKARVVSV